MSGLMNSALILKFKLNNPVSMIKRFISYMLLYSFISINKCFQKKMILQKISIFYTKPMLNKIFLNIFN
jgi:hypothetical protein